MGGLVYDVGALRAGPTIWPVHREALRRGETPLVIAPVLAAAGAPGAGARALLAGCALVDFPICAARDVGRLLARAGGGDLVAAAVVLAAVAARSAVATDRPAELHRFAQALQIDLALLTL